jgi:hypothetical membrane protein
MSSTQTKATLAGKPRDTSAATAVDGVRLSGLLLLILGAGFLTVTMLGASMAPNYDYAGGAISDLGVIRETAVLFNATLIMVGLLNIVGGYLFYRWHGRAWILSIFVLGGLGALGAGVFPLSSGGLHSLFALLAFVFFNVEAIAVAAVIAGPMRIVSILAGVVGLIFVVVMVIGDAGNPAIFGPIGHGGAERMIAFPAMLWTVAFGGYLMAARRESGEAS